MPRQINISVDDQVHADAKAAAAVAGITLAAWIERTIGEVAVRELEADAERRRRSR